MISGEKKNIFGLKQTIIEMSFGVRISGSRDHIITNIE